MLEGLVATLEGRGAILADSPLPGMVQNACVPGVPGISGNSWPDQAPVFIGLFYLGKIGRLTTPPNLSFLKTPDDPPKI